MAVWLGRTGEAFQMAGIAHCNSNMLKSSTPLRTKFIFWASVDIFWCMSCKYWSTMDERVYKQE
eukprot:m.69152 g.69152  ORF g.69152 m.69152 type:complete len:64 (-) comp24056_c0_seq1:206-397(-)